MQSEYDAYELFAMAAFNTLRLEALELFDRSLAKKQPAILEAFIERQMSQNVPPVDLLAQVSEDVHQRLQRLRQRNFELRETILRGAHNRFSIDLAPLLPSASTRHIKAVRVSCVGSLLIWGRLWKM